MTDKQDKGSKTENREVLTIKELNARLTKKSMPIEEVQERLRRIIEKMKEYDGV